VRSCLIDGEVVCCDKRGLATFQLLRHRRNEPQAFLYAFDLLELNGEDRRKEPLRGPQGNAGEHPTQEPARGTSR
jgi:ATP-dependent DNA ligase